MEPTAVLVYGVVLIIALTWFLQQGAVRHLRPWSAHLRHEAADAALIALVITALVIFLLLVLALQSAAGEQVNRGWLPPLQTRPH